jgi:hypothetical protein
MTDMDDQVLGSQNLSPLKVCGDRTDRTVVEFRFRGSNIGEIGHMEKDREKGGGSNR